MLVKSTKLYHEIQLNPTKKKVTIINKTRVSTTTNVFIIGDNQDFTNLIYIIVKIHNYFGKLFKLLKGLFYFE